MIQETNLDYLVVVAVSANFQIFCDGNNETLLLFLNENPLIYIFWW